MPEQWADHLSPRHRAELERFFVDVTFFEGKDIKVLRWGDAADGMSFVTRHVV